ncbi:protein MAL2 [Oryzias latipes]|uniref:Mal, T cell differentiation protein 2 n=1 Tax=Oryzias latipes TaxID=8090 RepID=A0A3B3HIQ4_ORYLA|nr:protein MAL2 [Oryzias latipes]
MSEPASNPAAATAAPVDPAAATSFPTATISLPLGLGVLRTYSGVLICIEIVFGGLVWILVASSGVPVPLMQGWVMFVSITTFFLSSAYLALLVTGLAERINTDWNFLDLFYHFIALLFYFAAFVLEAATTAAAAGVPITSSHVATLLSSRQYKINVAATIFAFVVTLSYGCSMAMGLKRWMK